MNWLTEQEFRIEYIKKKYPNVPAHALPRNNPATSAANALTEDVIKYIKFHGGQAYNIKVQGTWDKDRSKMRTSGMKKGLPDVMGILPGGQFIGVEIKIGKDRMREDQIKRMDEIQAAGGFFIVARIFTNFIKDLREVK